MSDEQPNIAFFWSDNFGWGELGCYGGGVLRGASTPRMDALAGEGLKVLNHNAEAQCTPDTVGPDITCSAEAASCCTACARTPSTILRGVRSRPAAGLQRNRR